MQELGSIHPPREAPTGDAKSGSVARLQVPYNTLESVAVSVRLHGGDVSSALVLVCSDEMKMAEIPVYITSCRESCFEHLFIQELGFSCSFSKLIPTILTGRFQ